MATETNTGLTYQEPGSLQTDVLQNAELNLFGPAIAGTVTRNFSSDANITLVAAEYWTSVLILTDTGVVLTAGRDVVFPVHFPMMLVVNSTAQTLTLKKSGQTGIAVAASESATIASGATDVVSAGGGSVDSVNGDTGAVIVPVPIGLACSDETSALTTGTAKITFRTPFAMTITAVRCSVTTAPTGSVLTVDINESGASILSTKLTIDAGEKTSTTAATPAVISDSALADDAEMTIDIDTVGSTIAGAGLKVWLIGYPA